MERIGIRAWCYVRQLDSPRSNIAAATYFAWSHVTSTPRTTKHTFDSQRARDCLGQAALSGESDWPCVEKVLEPRRSSSRDYGGFGGGLGGGTPVTSYAPRPMLSDVSSLVIMNAYGRLVYKVSGGLKKNANSWKRKGLYSGMLTRRIAC